MELKKHMHYMGTNEMGLLPDNTHKENGLHLECKR